MKLIDSDHVHIASLRERREQDVGIISRNRSYSGRASHRITEGQKRAYENGMRTYGLEYSQINSLMQQIGECASKYTRIIVDIGFGMGESLMQMARNAKEDLFIGIETFKPGIGALFVNIRKYEIDNIRVIHHDAVEVLFHMIELNTLDRIQIFFPDPWPKKRHHKRRMIHNAFFQLCMALLQPSGVLWIISDWEDYAVCIQEMLDNFSQTRNPLAFELIESDEYKDRQHMTKFQHKALLKGHHIHQFVIRKLL